MNFIQQYGKNRQRCHQNAFYYAVWQLLLYLYREFPSKILSVFCPFEQICENRLIFWPLKIWSPLNWTIQTTTERTIHCHISFAAGSSVHTQYTYKHITETVRVANRYRGRDRTGQKETESGRGRGGEVGSWKLVYAVFCLCRQYVHRVDGVYAELFMHESVSFVVDW